MNFIDGYARNCLPAGTYSGVKQAESHFLKISFSIRKNNLESKGTQLTKLVVRNPPLRILPALKYSFIDAWQHDRIWLIASTVSSIAIIALGILMLANLSADLMPLSLALIVAGIAFSVLKSPMAPRCDAIWHHHRAKHWAVFEQKKVEIPVKNEEALLNLKEESGWEDPINAETISLDILKTTKVIVVNNHAYFCSTLLNTFLSGVKNSPTCFIDPITNNALEVKERERVFEELSTILCVEKMALLKCWDTGKAAVKQEDIAQLRKQKFLTLTGYTTSQLEKFERAAVQALNQKAKVRPTPE